MSETTPTERTPQFDGLLDFLMSLSPHNRQRGVVALDDYVNKRIERDMSAFKATFPNPSYSKAEVNRLLAEQHKRTMDILTNHEPN